MFAGFSVLFPFFTYCTLLAIPAELNSLLFYGTPNEGAANNHSRFAFAPYTSAFALAMVPGTKSARKSTDTNLNPSKVHHSPNLLHRLTIINSFAFRFKEKTGLEFAG